MKVSFLKELKGVSKSPFSVYGFREDLRTQSHFVDIRAVVSEHESTWLNDLALSHSRLSESMLTQQNPWWWLTGYSRLDARPWGAESVIKPLFFSRAVLAWGQTNPSNDFITDRKSVV